MRAATPVERHAQVIDHHFGTFLGQELTDFPATLLLDSGVVACEDRVYCWHLMPRSLTGVQPCRSTSRISSMMCSVIGPSASCAGPTALRAPRVVSRNRSSSVAVMTRHPPVSATSVT